VDKKHLRQILAARCPLAFHSNRCENQKRSTGIQHSASSMTLHLVLAGSTAFSSAGVRSTHRTHVWPWSRSSGSYPGSPAVCLQRAGERKKRRGSEQCGDPWYRQIGARGTICPALASRPGECWPERPSVLPDDRPTAPGCACLLAPVATDGSSSAHPPYLT